MLYFISALYNEEDEIDDLVEHVEAYVDGMRLVDDGSTDRTAEWLDQYAFVAQYDFKYKVIEHTGLPETVKHIAKEMVPDGAWILMLDADERLTDETFSAIEGFFRTKECDEYDYIYFHQKELIDGNHVRTFQKAKLFRKEAVRFPLNNIHADDEFIGRGTYKDNWVVLHRKSTNKQITREKEYLDTYKRLLDEGSIDSGRYEWLKGLHHYVR
jgi:glycosyltransferase involved in cell wall biosynthesis